MFYLGTPNVSDAPDLIPSFPYLTMKAKGKSAAGPWLKQKDEYLQFFSVTTQKPGNPSVQRTLGIARTRDLDGPWTPEPQPMVPIEEQIENSTLYYEESIETWFLFTNHIGIDEGEYTDAIWVYWSKDINRFQFLIKTISWPAIRLEFLLVSKCCKRENSSIQNPVVNGAIAPAHISGEPQAIV